MIYGPFSLSDASRATLDFDLWKMIPDANDRVQVWYSTTTARTAPATTTSTRPAWAHVAQDLAAVPNGAGGTKSLLGQAQVWIMFRFVSDTSIQAECGYVDNVAIAKTVSLVDRPDDRRHHPR